MVLQCIQIDEMNALNVGTIEHVLSNFIEFTTFVSERIRDKFNVGKMPW